jgi:hypothetical protein
VAASRATCSADRTASTPSARFWPTNQWQTVLEENQQNEELLRLSNQILELTKAIHAMAAARAPADPTQQDGT